MRMIRLALRNQTKIKEVLGEKVLKDILLSLSNHRKIEPFTKEDLKLINVLNTNNKHEIFQFALLDGGLYGVQRVAYYKTIKI